MSVHLFGVRHHGPGSARSLVGALKELAPDIVLLEGPPDGQEMLSYVAHEGLQPPVAMLIYNAETPKLAAYYPFAEFSPEWQAIRFALDAKVPIRFMDLPQTHQLILPPKEEEAEAKAAIAVESEEAEGEEEDSEEKSEEKEKQGGSASTKGTAQELKSEPAQLDPEVEERQKIRRDPIGYIARMAGFTDCERWWDRTVENRPNRAGMFQAVHELMSALRAECGEDPDLHERQREAFMRQTIRAAIKEGFQKIAVVCGAWHTPGLEKLPSAKLDGDLLKGLPKAKVVATWIPWTYDRLSRRSGYGAGVQSPGWFEHLWETHDSIISTWMTKAARCFRKTGVDISPAHAIESTRLAETLATLRGTPCAGLAEVCEAIQTVYCFGDSFPMKLIEEQLIVGERLGEVPEEIPKVPLVQDVAKEQKRLRLPPKAGEETLDLDLRKPNDLDRSCLLHRLNILGVKWGQPQRVTSKTSTFHELWKLRWVPEFAVNLVESSIWGNTVAEAAGASLSNDALKCECLPTLSERLADALQAQLPDAVRALLQKVEEVAARTSDVPHLMKALPPLVNLQRYGDVRKTDTSTVHHVIVSLVARMCIGLPGACSSLDDDAADAMFNHLSEVDQSMRILNEPEQRELWHEALAKVSGFGGAGGLVAGRASRLLFEAKIIDAEQVERAMSLALSPALPGNQAAAWAEGLLRGSGLLLLHHPELLGLVDQWVSELTPEAYEGLLPLIRRTFATFTQPERRQMGEKLVEGRGAAELGKKVADEAELDFASAEGVLPLLGTIFGLENGS